MTTKTPNLVEVKKQMEADSVKGVLVDTYARISAGDLQDAMNVIVLVTDQYGHVNLCMGTTADEREALVMVSSIQVKLGLQFAADEDE
jgi:hypothetical protein